MKMLHYGLQRSGTNFMESILERRYKVDFLNSNHDRQSPLQKHFRIYDEKNIVPEPRYKNETYLSSFNDFEDILPVRPQHYIVISKDPYSWLLSYQKWAEKCNWEKTSHHYIEEYNLFYGKWLDFSLQTEKITFVRYIDLLCNTNRELKRLEDRISFSKKTFPLFKSASINKVPESSVFTKENRAYYSCRRYLERYSDEDLHLINQKINPLVSSSLGYRTVTRLDENIIDS